MVTDSPTLSSWMADLQCGRIKMKYDITAKTIIDIAKEEILHSFLGIESDSIELLEKADRTIYEDKEISKDRKADLLSAMAIFAGLKDEKLGIRLSERRRDIMIESPVYEFIKEEGRKEGIIEGMKEGMKEGRKEGLKEGLYNTLSLVLDMKFGTDGIALMEKVRKIDSIERLETIIKTIKTAKKIDEIKKLI